MKTKMKKYGDGGTKAVTRGIQPNPVAEANRLTAYPTTKVSKARAKLQSGGTSGGYPTTGGGKKMKTGGMVNPNANLQAGKTPGSKGVKSGMNMKAAASKTAKKPSMSRSKAPKKATPGRR